MQPVQVNDVTEPEHAIQDGIVYAQGVHDFLSVLKRKLALHYVHIVLKVFSSLVQVLQ